MKKNYLVLILFCLSLFQFAKAQFPPIMNPIQGPNMVCSSPASPKNFTASASGSPSSYTWTTYGTPGVIINSPNSAITSVSFSYPYPFPTFTLYCSSSNIAGTSNVVSFIVTVKETPSVTFSGANVFCQGSSTNLSASPTILSSSSTLTYSWSPSSGLNSTINYSVNCNANVSTNYSVLLTLGTCTNVAFVNVVVIPCFTSIDKNDLSSHQNLKTFPNPNHGNFSILADSDQRVQLLNEIGQHVQTLELRSGEETKITGLKPGLYFIISPNTRKKIVVTQ